MGRSEAVYGKEDFQVNSPAKHDDRLGFFS